MNEKESVSVEMTVDDLFAIHAVVNLTEALDEIFGESRERTICSEQMKSLRRRFKDAQARAQAETEAVPS